MSLRSFLLRLLILASLLGSPLFSAPGLIWSRLVDPSGNTDYARDMVQLDNGDLIVGGRKDSSDAGRFYVQRIKGSDGSVLWSREVDYPSGRSDNIVDLIADPATGDTYFAGNSSIKASGSTFYYQHWYVTKLNGSDGTVGWSTPYTFGTGTSNTTPRVLNFGESDAVTTIVVGGTTTFPNSRLVKLNTSDGSQVWTVGVSEKEVWGIEADTAGNLYVSGEGGYIAKYNAAGTRQWSSNYGPHGGSFNRWNYLDYDPVSDDVYVSGLIAGSTSTGGSANDLVTARYDGANGNQMWVRHVNGARDGNDSARGIFVDASGDVYSWGTVETSASRPPGRDAYVQRLNTTTGAIIWSKTLTGNNTSSSSGDELNNVVAIGSTVYVGVQLRSTSAYYFKFLKLNKSDGTTILDHDWTDRLPVRPIDDKGMVIASNGDFIIAGDSRLTGGAGEVIRFGDVVVNNAPTDISLSNATVNQSGGANATVGTLSTTDADSGDTHTYTLVAGSGDTDNGSFNISGSTLRATNAGALSAGSKSVRIQTDDGNGGTFAKQFSITVVDDVPPPVPSAPDLDAGSDTGSSSTDNITSDTTPTFTGTAETGAFVTVFIDVNGNNAYDAVGDTIVGIATAVGGAYSITPFAAQAEGTLTVKAVAGDGSNNSAATSALSITIDTTAPVITSGTTTSGPYGGAPSYTVSASGGATSFGGSGLTTGLSVNSVSGAITGSAGATGTANATINATDAAGNTGSGSLAITINPAALTITGLTGDNKVYDDTTAASASGTATLSGVVSGDDVSLGGSPVFTFASANVGTGITINTTGYTISGTDSGNYTLTQPTLSGNITGKELTITGLTGGDKTYDDTTAASASGTATLVGVETGDDVSLGGSPVFTFASANVGSGITINTTGYTISGTDSGNYTLTQPTLSGDITAKGLTITGITGDNKAYDGNTTGSASGTATLVGVETGDDVSLGGSPAFTFASANVGTGITVNTTGYTISGTDSGNYTLTQPTLSGDITGAQLTIVGLTGDNKTYDTTTSASATGTATLSGVIGADDVSLGGSPSFTFASANVGTGITINTTGYTIAGTDSGNYSLTQPTLSADITAAALTVTGATAENKVYDTTTAATLNTASASLVGVIGSDSVSLDSGSATASFGDKTVGTGKAVTVTGLGLSGTHAANYSLTQPTGLTANITAATLTMTGVTADNKVYDRSNSATTNLLSPPPIGPSSPALDGVLSGDSVGYDASSAVGTFADALAATGKTVTITGVSLTGSDAGNYLLTTPTATADITPAPLSINNVTASNRVYDAGTDATIDTASAALAGVISPDDVALDTASATGSFADKTVGTGKTVTTTGFTLTGSDAANYALTQPTATADITAATLTMTGVTAENKVYDGNTTATLNIQAVGNGGGSSPALDGVLSGDSVGYDAGSSTATFGDKTVGTGKAVTVTGVTLTGTDAGNYTLTQPTGVTANITALNLTVTGITAAGKVYDANAAAVINSTGATLVTPVSGDDVSVDASGAGAAFALPGIGTGITVQVSGLALTGADAGNYTLTQPTALADITARGITITGLVAQNKVYDATTDANIDDAGLNLVGVQGSDVLTIDDSGANATFADKNVGTGKAVTLTGAVLAGSAAGNYTLTLPTDLTADITAAPLTLTGVVADNKVYDGNTTATHNLNVPTLTGPSGSPAFDNIQGSDNVGYDGGSATGTFAQSDVGTGITVTIAGVTLTGTDAGNYDFSQPTGVSADITAKELTVTAEDKSVPYGDPLVALTYTLTGFISGEDENNISGEPALSTTATRTSAVSQKGDYPITTALGSLTATNYSFSLVNGTYTVQPGFHFADTDRNNAIELAELLRVIELYNYREGTRRLGSYSSNDANTDRYEPGGDGTRILPHTADFNGDGQISLLELTRMIELYNTRSGSTRTGAYHYDPSTEDGFAPGPGSF